MRPGLEPSRSDLARDQAALVTALAGRGGAPAGFDEARIGLLRSALRRKRARAIIRTWPRLGAALADFDALVEEFMTAHPGPSADGPAADGRDFAAFLGRSQRLPWEGRLERIGDDLRRRRRLAAVALDPHRGWMLALRVGTREVWVGYCWRR